MNPSPNATSSHRLWWRRLRRRYPLGVFLSGAFPWWLCLPAIGLFLAFVVAQWGIVAWMWRDRGWNNFAAFARWVWFFVCVLGVVTMALWLVGQLWARRLEERGRLCAFVALLVNGLGALALLMGRIDWAVAIVYGLGAANKVCNARDWKLWRLSLPNAFLSLGVVTAFFAGWPWIVAACLFLPYVLPVFFKPTLREMLANKPTRREFIEKIRERCESGKERAPFALLQGLIQAEMWDEALDQLERQVWPEWMTSNSMRKENWQAEIYLGSGRYEDVLRLHDGDKQADSPLAVYLAVAHAKLGHRELARRIAHEVKRRAGRYDQPDAERAMGDVLFEAGEHERALECYEKGMMSRDAMRAMGKSLMTLGDYAEARLALQQAIRFTSWVRAEDLLLLAECLRHLGEERAAAEAKQLAREYAEPASGGEPSLSVTAPASGA